MLRWLGRLRLDEQRPFEADLLLVLGDEMQMLFGGRESFDWGPKELEGAIAPLPAFDPYGTTKVDDR